MIPHDEFERLLEKYIVNNLSDEEQDLFFSCVKSGKYDEILSSRIHKDLLREGKENHEMPAFVSEKIIRKILAGEKGLPVSASRRILSPVFYWAAAACIIIFISTMLYLRMTASKEKSLYTEVLTGEMINKKNNSKKALILEMEDGSSIVLQPGSQIHYSYPFLQTRREVYLDGEAFFKVSKNKNAPFYVYAGNIVTYVLGTSFNVKADKQKKELEVSVTSGRVVVYEKNKKVLDKKTGNGVVLLPNQKIIYNEENHQFISSLIDVPLPLKNSNDSSALEIKNQFVFRETPLSEVLNSLSKCYGIDLLVENENLNNCLITGDLSSQDLYERLDLICQAINATYEIKETKILIKGKGCE